MINIPRSWFIAYYIRWHTIFSPISRNRITGSKKLVFLDQLRGQESGHLIKKLCRVFDIISLMINNLWNQSQNSQIFMVTSAFTEVISFVLCFLFMNLMSLRIKWSNTRKNVSPDVYITLDGKLKPWTRCSVFFFFQLYHLFQYGKDWLVAMQLLALNWLN